MQGQEHFHHFTYIKTLIIYSKLKHLCLLIRRRHPIEAVPWGLAEREAFDP